jgi:hypothetical protein
MTNLPMTVKRQRGMVDQREISVTQNLLLLIKLNCTPRGWRFLTWMLEIKKYLGEKTFHYVKMNNCTVTSYKTQIERMRDPEHVTYSEKFRAWIKLKANNVSADVSAAEEEQVEEGALRYVTMDKVSTVYGWKLMHKDSEGIDIETLMTERNCVELLIEKIKSGYYDNPKWENWPRYSDLCVWQDQLRANDVIDVHLLIMKDNKWQ